MRSRRAIASSVTTPVTQCYSSCRAALETDTVLAPCASSTSGKHRAGYIGNCSARQLFLQSLDRGRCRLPQNREDMGADRAGCARRRPMLGEELAALQRGEDIAQGDVARRPRQFEAAPRAEPGADQSSRRHQREEAANHDRVGVGAIRHVLRTQHLARIGGESRQQMNADGKSGARSHLSLVARRAPILQNRASPRRSG